MAKFGTSSMTRISSCTRDIQTILLEVVKYRDCTIVEGNRTEERQHEHWQKGRKLKKSQLDAKKADNWEIVDKKKIVTYKDGYTKKSKHQAYPSIAVDVVPYPEMYKDEIAMHELRGVINYVQDRLYEEGKIERKLDNGYDLWNGWDLPHYQMQ